MWSTVLNTGGPFGAIQTLSLLGAGLNAPGLLEGYGATEPEGGDSHREERIRPYRIFYQLIGVYVGFAEYNDPDMYQNSRQAIRELL